MSTPDAAGVLEIRIVGGDSTTEHARVALLGCKIEGRRVVEVVDDLPTKDPGWSDHGSIVLVFDDGSRLRCGGWGHDAWGPDLTWWIQEATDAS